MFSIIISVILLITLFVILGLGINTEGYEPKITGFKLRGRQIFALLGLLPILMTMITFIPVNSVGIQFNQFNGVSENVLTEGMKFKTPFDAVYVISTEVQTKHIAGLTSQTRDSQFLTIILDVKYRVTPAKAFEVFKEFKTLANADEVLIQPAVKRAIESVSVNYNAIDFIGEDLNKAYIEIEKALEERLAESGIQFFSLALIDIDAGSAIENAIVQEAVAKKAVETAMQTQQRAQVEAQTKVLEATSAAEVKVIQATADAQVKAIAAEAEAEANRKISASLTPGLLTKMEMEARLVHGWVTIQGADAIVVK